MCKAVCTSPGINASLATHIVLFHKSIFYYMSRAVLQLSGTRRNRKPSVDTRSKLWPSAEQSLASSRRVADRVAFFCTHRQAVMGANPRARRSSSRSSAARTSASPPSEPWLSRRRLATSLTVLLLSIPFAASVLGHLCSRNGKEKVLRYNLTSITLPNVTSALSNSIVYISLDCRCCGFSPLAKMVCGPSLLVHVGSGC